MNYQFYTKVVFWGLNNKLPLKTIISYILCAEGKWIINYHPGQQLAYVDMTPAMSIIVQS